MIQSNILVVEDNPDLRRHLQAKLERKNYQCSFASNEKEGLNMYNHELYAIIVDIDLSETGGSTIGGIELAESLVEIKSDVPIILISQTPASFTPYEMRQHEMNIVAVLDRNDDLFWDHLIKCLEDNCGKS